MKWLAEWRELSKRIDQLLRSADFLVNCDRSLGAGLSSDGIVDNWLPHAQKTAKDLRKYLERLRPLFPAESQSLFTEYNLRIIEILSVMGQGLPAFKKLQYFISFLLTFQAEINHLLGDFEPSARRTIERAFTHLQRSLIVDKGFGTRWCNEFDTKGELGVEKLGAVHLLGHGIWAFKVSTIGERTDLILGERIKDELEKEVFRTAEVLALTEWKVIKNTTESKLKTICQKALTQAKLYSEGALAGVELEKTRYLVLVSLNYLPHCPKDHEENGVTYRYINIAIKPTSPSRQKT